MKVSASPVKELALEAGIPVFQPEKMRDGTALAQLQSLQPELLVVVAYGRILPDDILAVPPLGAINVHASLLPLRFAAKSDIRCWPLLGGYLALCLEREGD